MRRIKSTQRTRLKTTAGLTLLELILACGILIILSSAAIPVARMTIQRQRETQLRSVLREMRTAIDRYKDDADKNLIRTEVGSENYPPDLQTLVDGVTISVGTGATGGISASALAAASAGSASASSQLNSVSSGQGLGDTPSKVRYLRKIPVDPMTGKAEWGLRSVQDDPGSDSWGGHNVFDVYSQSQAMAIDGTKYSDW